MCGCEHHHDTNAPCSCVCPEHLSVTTCRLSRVMRSLACGSCGVGPFEDCLSKSGRRVPMHSARWYDAKEVTGR